MIYDDLELGDIEGWLTPEEAEWLHERAAKSKRVLEIGCFQGRSTCSILSSMNEFGPHSMVVVDTFNGKGTSRESEFVLADDHGKLLSRLMRNIWTRSLPMPLIIVGEAAQARLFSPQFDFIFIDGSHDEASVRDDLETARRVAVPGCIVAVHDYGDADRKGLTRAVDDFFEPSRPIVEAGSIAWGRI